MELIDTIAVRHQGNERFVMLFVGDLASLPEREAVDLLVVSAFYMKLVHCDDVREGDRVKIAQSAERLLKHV